MTPPATARADKRAAILDAALELFVDRGFHGTAVPEIAARASVGAGTIYRYFTSKEALVNALYRQQKQELAHRMVDDMPTDVPAREQFHLFWSRLAEFAMARPRAWAFLELHHHASYLDEDSRAVERRLEDLAEALLRRSQERGQIRNAPPRLLMALVLGAFVGVLRCAWEGKLPLDPDTLATAEQCCWEAIRV